ncbi:MAG: alpha/beta hydrolase-fold protein [Polyangiaceae bacterium]
MALAPGSQRSRFIGLFAAALGFIACSGDPELSAGPAGSGAGAGSSTATGEGAGTANGGAGGFGGGGAAGQAGTTEPCEPVEFAPKPEAYPVDIAGQTAWVHDEGFSSGYFHTYDALTLAGADDRPRKVHVFLPRDYPESCDRYPAIYMNDGETTFWPGGPGNKSWNVAQGLESLYSEGAIGPVIVVAIHAIDRNVEYSHTEWAPDTECCGVEKYADYVADAVKGFVDANYRTAPEAEKTAIVGSSRGGLCAFVLASLRPDSFRMAGCLSPSFWLGLEPAWGGDYSGELATSKLLDMTKGTLSDPAQRPALWIDWGLVFTGGFHNEVIEKNAADYGQQMVDLLQSDYGYSVGQGLSWMEDPMGEHDEVSWARRFPLVMKAFYGVR